ncbi:hypothetical protein PoB_000328900 [Plakobranchus ocellatus]|uniref:Uncharacterized protein n=1 Tax=Plakobranchus ocellatus TaxID=259542 RepID=A0AAV3Y1F6_9GAST|nr:hypothetical protein PoB_000328900 [Plakobranchus ocellatus]
MPPSTILFQGGYGFLMPFRCLEVLLHSTSLWYRFDFILRAITNNQLDCKPETGFDRTTQNTFLRSSSSSDGAVRRRLYRRGGCGGHGNRGGDGRGNLSSSSSKYQH